MPRISFCWTQMGMRSPRGIASPSAIAEKQGMRLSATARIMGDAGGLTPSQRTAKNPDCHFGPKQQKGQNQKDDGKRPGSLIRNLAQNEFQRQPGSQ